MTCPKCGTVVASGLGYCTNCGSPVEPNVEYPHVIEFPDGLILTCPACRNMLRLPESAYGLTKCGCGRLLRFRTGSKTGIVTPQHIWIPPIGTAQPDDTAPPEDTVRHTFLGTVQMHAKSEEFWESSQVAYSQQPALNSLTAEPSGKVTLECPSCSAEMTLIEAGYDVPASVSTTCNACGLTTYPLLPRLSFQVAERTRISNGSIPTQGYLTAPVIDHLRIYCSVCGAVLGRRDIPNSGAVFENKDAGGAYDKSVCPRIGEVWTVCVKCKQEAEKAAQTQANQQRMDEERRRRWIVEDDRRKRVDNVFDGAGRAWGCLVGTFLFLLGVGMLPFFPFGTVLGLILMVYAGGQILVCLGIIR